MARGQKRIAWAAALLLVLAGAAWFALGRTPAPKAPLGLFTSLPIVWSEQVGVRDMLASPEPRHWAFDTLERHGQLVALDTLLDLSRIRRLVIAQPRPLGPEENVALDTWVRGGGRVLLFADPMLTQESSFALGDRRRPQDIALLSPILGRWGLELRFDESQPGGSREIAGEGVPVNLPGQLAAIPGGVGARCRIGPQALIARCKIGQGQAIVIADAALLEPEANPARRSAALDALLNQAFAQ